MKSDKKLKYLNIAISPDTKLALVLDFTKEYYQFYSPKEVIIQAATARFLPRAMSETNPKWHSIALQCLCEVQSWASTISQLIDAPTSVKGVLNNCNDKYNLNITMTPNSKIYLVNEYIKQYYEVNSARDTIAQTVISRFLPLAMSPSLPTWHSIALQCLCEVQSWAINIALTIDSVEGKLSPLCAPYPYLGIKPLQDIKPSNNSNDRPSNDNPTGDNRTNDLVEESGPKVTATAIANQFGFTKAS